MAMQESDGTAERLVGLDHHWQQKWLDDDEDQDSDTDSKLSGSAAADSVMRHLVRSRLPFKGGGTEFGLDTMREQDEDEVSSKCMSPDDLGSCPRKGSYSGSSIVRVTTPHCMSNGFHHHNHLHSSPSTNTCTISPQLNRRQQLTTSPQFQPRQRLNYENTQVTSSYQRKEILGLPTSGGARVVEISVPTLHHTPPKNWGVGVGIAPGTQSMENIVSPVTPPNRSWRRTLEQIPNGVPHYRDVKTSVTTNNDRGHQNALSSTHSQSHEHIPKMGGVDGVSYSGDHTNNDVRGEISAGSYMQSSHGRNGSASQPALNPRGHTRSHSGAGSGVIPIPRDMKHFRSMSIGSGTPPALTPISGGNLSVSYSHSAELRQLAALTSKPQSMGSSGSVTMDSHKTPPQRRGNYGRHDLKGAGSGGEQQEPNLKDVVQFLHSDDRILVSNAASYIQHLAYGDDNMKKRIREHGVIPILVNLIHHPDTKVQITVLSALKNLSYGRTTNENKHLIATDQRLMEIIKVLRSSRVAEIRDLLTQVLWNLSSCEELKLRLIQSCLHDLVEVVMVPYTGWNTEDAREATSRPRAVHWNSELMNTTGTLRNVSSAGESARSFMRSTNGMVDTLLWLLKAGVQQKSAANEKTVENTVCILRNLSYRLANEIDAQECGEDILDREWEQEQRNDIEELSHSFSKNSPGCLPFCVRPHSRHKTAITPITAAIRPVYTVDFVYPDASVMPKRHKPVYGKCLLWQPEVAFVYLAVVEQYPDSIETLVAATGAIRNLTSCQWKWSAYIRNIIRTSNGLHLLGNLLCNGHDTVVCAAALALRNLTDDQRNTESLGVQSIINILHRLPFGMNHLGISEETSVALLFCLVELFNNSPENAESFRVNDGIVLLAKLVGSREHTSKVTCAAHKVCSQLWDYKECKSLLKKMGWELCHYHRLIKSVDSQMELEPRGSISTDNLGPQRKKRISKRSSKKSSKKKDRDRERERAEAEIGFIAGELPPAGEKADVHPQNPMASSDLSGSSSQLQEISEDPNYQTIPLSPPLPSSAHPSNHITQHTQQEKESHTTLTPSRGPNYESMPLSPHPAPVNSDSAAIIYQSIDDLPLRSSLQSARADVASTSISTSGGALSATSQEEEAEADPDPCSTYAVVDKEKKRASRMLRDQKKKEEEEREKHKQPDSDLDSWV